MIQKENDTKVKYNRDTPVITLEKGKLPPQAVDLEEAILGAALTTSSSISEVVEIFREEKVFYKSAHQLIYDSMYQMFQDGEPIDLLTISDNLRSKGNLDKIGGEYYLIQLTNKISSSAHIEFHSRIVMQMHIKRKTIKLSNEMIDMSYNEETDIFELLASSQKEIDDVAQWLIRKKPKEFRSIVRSFLEKAENDVAGIINSLKKLQLKLNGWRNADLVIIAARPGMGKSVLMINEAKKQAKCGIPVGIFSLEMSANDLVGRMIADECEIDYGLIHSNRLTDFHKRLIKEKMDEFEKLPIFIHDQPGITPMEFKIQAGKWKRENGVQICYLDYLQLMSAAGKNNSGNREQEISSISRSLKGTAKDLDIPVIALCQLSRACESRGGMKRPILSDLRESGAIEQDADIVIFIYRPEYYKIEEWDDDDRTSTKGQAELIIAKFRGGQTGETVVGCELNFMRFHDLDQDRDPFFDQFKETPPKPNSDMDAAFGPDEKEDEEKDDVPF